MTSGLSTTLHTSFEDAVDRTTKALADQGFGVLTTIDVKATLKQKLGEEMENYLILGACNPGLAHRALGILQRHVLAARPTLGRQAIQQHEHGHASRIEPAGLLGPFIVEGVKFVATARNAQHRRAVRLLRRKNDQLGAGYTINPAVRMRIAALARVDPTRNGGSDIAGYLAGPERHMLLRLHQLGRARRDRRQHQGRTRAQQRPPRQPDHPSSLSRIFLMAYAVSAQMKTVFIFHRRALHAIVVARTAKTVGHEAEGLHD